MSEQITYKEIKPKMELKNFVHSFWMHQNNTATREEITIVPDSYFKIIITVKNNKVIAYFLIGLWTEEKTIAIAPHAITYGCRLKILAPKFLLNKQLALILNDFQQLKQKNVVSKHIYDEEFAFR